MPKYIQMVILQIFGHVAVPRKSKSIANSKSTEQQSENHKVKYIPENPELHGLQH